MPIFGFVCAPCLWICWAAWASIWSRPTIFSSKRPYRARGMKLIPNGDHIVIENFTLKDPDAFYGASRDLGHLSKLTSDQFQKMGACNMIVFAGRDTALRARWSRAKPVWSSATAKPLTWIVNSRLTRTQFISWDRGRDPETDEHIWGSLAGPFQVPP